MSQPLDTTPLSESPPSGFQVFSRPARGRPPGRTTYRDTAKTVTIICMTNTTALNISPRLLRYNPAMRDVEYVVLLFDPATQTIGMRPAKADTPDAFKLTPFIGRFTISIHGLLKAYGIVPQDVAGVHPAVWDKDTNMLLIRLKD